MSTERMGDETLTPQELEKFDKFRTDRQWVLALLLRCREMERSDAALREEVERLRGALERIANPIESLRKQVEAEGCRLDGHAAVALSNDARWLRDQAARALSESKDGGG